MISEELPFTMDNVDYLGEMRYDENQPYSLYLRFVQEDRGIDVQWEVSRDLVYDGMRGDLWTGLGDLVVRRESHTRVCLSFRPSQYGKPDAPFYVPVHVNFRTLRDFLYRTYNLVPRGEEVLDWDSLEADRASW